MTTVAENMAAFAATLKYEELPAEVVQAAKRITIDTVGCAFGGYANDVSKIARDMAELVTSSQPATVFFTGQKTSVDLAAFANDVMVRYLDYNDGYISDGSGHPSDSIPALLAAAEVMHSSGRELVVATVLAYEIFGRMCDAWDNKGCGIDHSTMGGIATVVGVARLFKLTKDQIAEAINIWVAGNIGLNQTRIGHVSNWKSCGYANANRNAIFAVQLAARSMTGPSPIFEGRNGFFKIVSRKEFGLEFGGDKQKFRIMQLHIKQFPLGNFSQTVVTGIMEARKVITDPGEITEIHIRTSSKALNIMADSPDKWRPPNSETADHSIPYTVGVALMYGSFDRIYFEEKHFKHDQPLLELISRIKCSPSPEADSRDAEINPCELEITLRSGERKAFKVEFHRGHWRNPMSEPEIEAKFRSLVGTMLPATRIDALLKQLWKLEDMSDIGKLIPMLVI